MAVPRPDDDNPIIMSTMRELAWAAWQISRGRVDWKLGDWVPDLDASFVAWPDGDPRGPLEIERFNAWWTWATSGPIGSLRDLIESAWNKAREHRSFGNFWATIVAGQPVINVAASGVALCDCGHPISYHREHTVAGNPSMVTTCGWNPPHSQRRCACAATTTTGIARDQTYNRDHDKKDPTP